MRNIIFFLLLIASSSFGQNCQCDSIFKTVQYNIETNYAGWFDKTKQFDKTEFDELVNKVTLNVQTITSDSLCYLEIKKYVDYFHDGHLHLNIRYPKPQHNVESKPINITRLETTEAAIMAYLKSARQLNIAEGIWENETYKIGIIKAKENSAVLNGVILSSKNENWKSGEIKLTIETNKNSISKLSFITGDKTELIVNNAVVYKNILDAKNILLAKVYPESKDTISLDEYSLEHDPTNPTLTFPKKDLAVWTFPNFYPQNSSIVQILLAKHSTKLASAKNWIIDLRKNEGGEVRVGNLLLPYLYTKPIIWYNEFSRLTEDNFNKWYNAYLKDLYDGLTRNEQLQIDSLLSITKSNFGKFGNWNNENKLADTVVFESKKPVPEKVVILIDKDTFSSGELFAILARQSDKVIVMGEKSAGSIDYGNIFNYKTNCPAIFLTLPTSRNNWLDNGISIDRDKVQPDVYIPKNAKNWIDFAYEQINSSGKK